MDQGYVTVRLGTSLEAVELCADQEFGADILGLFPAPSVPATAGLIQELIRIHGGVPWVANALGSDWECAALERVGNRITQHLGGARLPRKELRRLFNGPYLYSGTLVAPQSAPPRGHEQLRAVLWACAAHWTDQHARRKNALERFASALRQAIAEPNSPDGSKVSACFALIGPAGTLPGLIERAQVLGTCGHQGMEDVWMEAFQPALKEILAGGGVAKPHRKRKPKPATLTPLLVVGPAPSPPGAGPSGFEPVPRSEEDEDEEDEIDCLVDRAVVVEYVPSELRATLDPTEVGDEASTVVLVPAPGRYASTVQRKLMQMHLHQAIWSSNTLLLPNHRDALTLEVTRLVIGAVMKGLEEAPADSDAHPTSIHLQQGRLVLLLFGLTGRASGMVSSIVLAPATTSSLEVAAWGLDVDVGQLWCPAVTPPQGGTWNESALEPVGNRVILDLPLVVRSVLVRHRRGLERLARTAPEQIDALARLAARHIKAECDLPFTPGRLRRALACHVHEVCRDVAMTQLVCGDTLGASLAPLHYYAPRVHAVNRVYGKAAATILGISVPANGSAGPEERVGSRYLVTPTFARKLANQSRAPLIAGAARLNTDARRHELHNFLADHLARMLLSVANHRSVNALFSLKLSSLDLVGGIGLFNDKQFDAVHSPRAVGLAPCVVEQLKSYLAHLDGLATLVPAAHERARDALHSKAALLFWVNEEGGPIAMDLANWRARLPPIWREVPLNWGRTFMRTRLVEDGLPAELAMVQLGHLEGAGYPFSRGSPTEPMIAFDVINACVEQVARKAGWKVHAGLPSESPRLVPKLRSWEATVAKAERKHLESARNWRDFMRSETRRYRTQSIADVWNDTEMSQWGIQEALEGDGDERACRRLKAEDFERVSLRLVRTAEGDAALAIARVNALRRVVRRLDKCLALPDRRPCELLALRQPLDNPFFQGMMVAPWQVHQLRKDWTSTLSKRVAVDTSEQAARAALALALFGFVDDPDIIRGALLQCGTLVAPERLHDTLLVQWGGAPHEVLAVRGLAAIALGQLAKQLRMTGSLPDLSDLDLQLRTLLPAGVVADTAPTLKLLCETVGVTNRLELSPAARFALGKQGGSVNACVDEQRALIDMHPVDTWVRSREANEVGPAGTQPLPRSGSGVSARRQYGELLKLIPRERRTLVLPRTGVSVSADQLFRDGSKHVDGTCATGIRAQIILEINAMLEETMEDDGQVCPKLVPSVRLLAVWIRHLFEFGTPIRSEPAESTIHTYVTRIGGQLVELLGMRSLQDLDVDELEDLYVKVVEYPKMSRDKVASSVLLFHRDCSMYFDLPQSGFAEVRSYLAPAERLADARLILPSEREEAIRRLAAAAEASDAPTRSHTRLRRQATTTLRIWGFTGARHAEVTGIKFGDMHLASAVPTLHIRKNRSRRIKSRGSRRIIDLLEMIPEMHLDSVRQWVATDGGRIPEWERHRRYVYTPLDDPRSTEHRSEIARLGAQALADVTGRRTERLHRLRHLVGYERLVPVLAGPADRAAMDDGARWQEEDIPALALAMPRDLMARVHVLGHAHWKTTLAAYFHAPWLARSRADALFRSRYLNRHAVATALGKTVWAADRIVQRGKGRRPADWMTWFDHVRPSAAKPAPIQNVIDTQAVDEGLPVRIWTAGYLDDLLGTADRMKSLEAAGRAAGLLRIEVQQIDELAGIVEARLGRCLWHEAACEERKVPVIRRLSGADQLGGLLAAADDPTHADYGHIHAIVQGVLHCAQPRHNSTVILPKVHVGPMTKLLEKHGIPADLIRIEEWARGLIALNIVAPSKPDPEKEQVGIPLAPTRVPADVSSAPAVVAPGKQLGLMLKQKLALAWIAEQLNRVRQDS